MSGRRKSRIVQRTPILKGGRTCREPRKRDMESRKTGERRRVARSYVGGPRRAGAIGASVGMPCIDRPTPTRRFRAHGVVARKRSANIVENMQYPPSRRRAPTV
ncbi:hypothetical protein DN475_02015 [Burkholderia multivorans]|nr:hypothetical protein DN475_02015 [Burkholderia multivorans]